MEELLIDISEQTVAQFMKRARWQSLERELYLPELLRTPPMGELTRFSEDLRMLRGGENHIGKHLQLERAYSSSLKKIHGNLTRLSEHLISDRRPLGEDPMLTSFRGVSHEHEQLYRGHMRDFFPLRHSEPLHHQLRTDLLKSIPEVVRQTDEYVVGVNKTLTSKMISSYEARGHFVENLLRESQPLMQLHENTQFTAMHAQLSIRKNTETLHRGIAEIGREYFTSDLPLEETLSKARTDFTRLFSKLEGIEDDLSTPDRIVLKTLHWGDRLYGLKDYLETIRSFSKNTKSYQRIFRSFEHLYPEGMHPGEPYHMWLVDPQSIRTQPFVAKQGIDGFFHLFDAERAQTFLESIAYQGPSEGGGP